MLQQQPHSMFSIRRLLSAKMALTGAILATAASSASATLTTDYQSLVSGTTGLQNYWSFEDLGTTGSFTTVADSVSSKDGTAIGTVESQLGLVGYTGYFAGDTDSATINNVVEILGSDTDTTFDLSGTSFTIEALVRTDTLPGDNWSGIVTKGDSAWRIARNSGNDYIQSAASGLSSPSNAFHDLDNDIWHYVALIYDSTANTVTSVFDDTIVVNTVDPADTISVNDYTVMIGGNAQKTEREWQGYIDEVAIYTTALTSSDINARLAILDADPSAIDQAAIAYWTGSQATGSMTADAGWDNTAPTAGDTVVIGKGGDVIFSGGVLNIDNLEVGTTTDLIGNDSDGTGKLTVTGGELYINGGNDGTIGKGTYGEVYQTGGAIYFAGEDYELGEDPNGEGVHTMTGGLLQIGYWAEDTDFSGGYFMTNDSGSGDDLSIGRDRNGVAGETARGELNMSGDSVVRVSNDMFLDVGIAEVTMTDTALIHVGDDLRAGSADEGEGFIEMSGNSNIKVEGRFSIADSNLSVIDVTLNDNALVEVGMYMTVSGQDSLNEAGVGTLTINDSAQILIGEFLYRGDVGGEPGLTGEDIPAADRVADEQMFFIGAGSSAQGSGTVYQNGSGSLVSVNRAVHVGHTATGDYYLSGGTLEVTGDAPISGVDFTAGLSDDDGFVDAGGDLIIGYDETGVGMLSVEGGDLDVARDLIVGYNGTGRLRVEGSGSTITIAGDLSFGGTFAGAAGEDGTFEVALTGTAHSVVEVVGGAEGGTILGDLLVFGSELDADFADGYRPTAGDYSSSPLEWLVIDYAGSRNGAFTLVSGLTDGTLNGAEWDVRYDDVAGEVYLQATTVYMIGDVNLDGVVDSTDEGIVTTNLGLADLGWIGGDLNGDGITDSNDLAFFGLLDGDFNGDGFVGLDDLDIVLSNWNQNVTPNDLTQGDANGDGFVGLDDLDIILNNWNNGTPPTASAIPEPATLALMGLGVFALVRRR